MTELNLKDYREPIYYEILGQLIKENGWNGSNVWCSDLAPYYNYYQRAVNVFVKNEIHNEKLKTTNYSDRSIKILYSFYCGYTVEMSFVKLFKEAYNVNLKFNGIHDRLTYNSHDNRPDTYDEETGETYEIKYTTYKETAKEWQDWAKSINPHKCDALLIYCHDTDESYLWLCNEGVPDWDKPALLKKQMHLEKNWSSYGFYLEYKGIKF